MKAQVCFILSSRVLIGKLTKVVLFVDLASFLSLRETNLDSALSGTAVCLDSAMSGTTLCFRCTSFDISISRTTLSQI